MPARFEELTGTFIAEVHRFDDTVIGEIEADPVPGQAKEIFAERTLVKGDAQQNELIPKLRYRFTGVWHNYFNKRLQESQRQFWFSSFIKVAPLSREGIVAYLQRCPWVGPARARLLWDVYGDQAVKQLREHPRDCLENLDRRITLAQVTEASDRLWEDHHLENCSIELIGLLDKRGFPKKTLQRVLRKYGSKAPELLRRNPYLLMQFPGIGFKKADAMYLDLKLPIGSLKRQALCAWHCIAKEDGTPPESSGSTWFPIEVAIAGIRRNVGGVNINPQKALSFAKRIGQRDSSLRGGLAFHKSNGRQWVADALKADDERYVAARVADAMREECHWPNVGELAGLTDHQRSEAAKALSSPMSALLGNPGTGKSYSTAALIRSVMKMHGEGSIAVAAPTGKAANRITTLLQQYDVGLRATTIHSLLGVQGNDDGQWSFRHNEDNPLPFKFLFLDESSMPAVNLMRSLLAARARGTNVLFIGDVGQLPPIQHGAPLRDFLRAGLPFGELKEPHRNAGTIVYACKDIRDGRPFREDESLAPDELPPRNFKVIRAANPEQQIERLLQVIDLAKRNGRDPVWDVQPMVAVNETSPVSRKALNKILQAELNSTGEGMANCPFRTNDKVICTDNGRYIAAEENASYADAEGNVFVANGEFGRVIEVAEKFVVARFDYPQRFVKFLRGKADAAAEGADGNAAKDSDAATGCNLDLAFSCTVHRMQGSECPIAVPMIDDSGGAKMICSREWHYTAASRGKYLTLPIGRRETMEAHCRKTAIDKRKTFLAELILAELDNGNLPTAEPTCCTNNETELVNAAADV